MINNYQNYFIYDNLVKNGKIIVETKTINKSNWREHYEGILNILKDGIEDKYIQSLFVTVKFDNNATIDLSLVDYQINLILWYPLLIAETVIRPKHIMFKNTITSKDIKNYVDKYFIKPNRRRLNNRILNNSIADMLHNFVDVDLFSFYLTDTLNLEDDINLMNSCSEYKHLLHCDLSNVPIEKVKDAGLEITHKAIDYIMNSENIMGYDHCLRNAFAAEEGISVRQYKENHFSIGTKPDGHGAIYHDIINQSYINGGLNKPLYQLIDSGASRVAQIISKKEVGDSGGFSRVLGLNNLDSFLNKDPSYDCHTKNFIYLKVSSEKVLNMLNDRYYRLAKDGMEFRINSEKDKFLIGRNIYLRSPITCASYHSGHGICYKCYGDLAFTNYDINVGRIATELITEILTQMRLSAKHLLETSIPEILWCDLFLNYFEIDTNVISLSSEFVDNLMINSTKGLSGWELVINEDDIQMENDDEFFKHNFYSDDQFSSQDSGPFYNEYVTQFYLKTPTGELLKMYSKATEDSSEAKMYISNGFSNIIREWIKRNGESEESLTEFSIPVEELEDTGIFLLKIQNNDLGKTLDIFNDLINKKDITKSFTKDELIERLQDVMIKGKINVMSIHLEVIIANQIRSYENKLKYPNWMNENEKYEILTLSEALTDNPSIIKSLLYEKIAKSTYYPLSFKKTAPTIFDPFFMRQPKKFLNCKHEVWDEVNKPKIKPGESPVLFVHDHSGERPKDIKKLLKPFIKDEPTELDD